MTEDAVKRDRSMNAKENNSTLDRAYSSLERASQALPLSALELDQTDTRLNDVQHSRASTDYANASHLSGPMPQLLTNDSLSTDPGSEGSQR